MSTEVLKVNNGDACKVRYQICVTPQRENEAPCYGARAEVKTVSLRAIAEQVEREGSKYDASEVICITEHVIGAIIDRLRHGYSVNFGSMMRFRPSIKGRFEHEEDEFDANRHQLVVAVSAGSQLRHALDGVSVERIKQTTTPKIRKVDVSLTESMILVQVMGSALYRQDLGETAQWFIEVDHTRKPIQPQIQKQNGREVIFSLPRKTYAQGTTFTLILRITTPDCIFDYPTAPITL